MKIGLTPPVRALKLVWSDEFDGPPGMAPDAKNWRYDLGGHGFGNHELQYYTDRPDNVRLEDGNLVIEARQEEYTGTDFVTKEYTSARLTTAGLFEQQFGRIEARVKLPEGRGVWPGFWALGSDISQVGWPNCGEIDMMEMIGSEPSTVHGTAHGPGYSGAHGVGGAFSLPEGERFSQNFHLFSVDWSSDSLECQVDYQPYHRVRRESLPEGTPWVFDHPFSLLLNVAVGGDWPGSPDSTTRFPQRMLVDYVRAYQAAD